MECAPALAWYVEPRPHSPKHLVLTRAERVDAGVVEGCREQQDQVMQGGEPPLSDVGSGEDGQGSASAPRRKGMAPLAVTSPCAMSASANAMGAGC